MRVFTIQHVRGSGWRKALPTELDSPNTLVLAFGAPAYAEDDDDIGAIADLRRAFPTSHIIGCSTAGEISGTTIEDGTLTVSIARFDRTQLRSAFEPIGRTVDRQSRIASASFESGASVAGALVRDDLRGVFVLSSGDNVNGSELARGMQSVLGDVPVSGALAADGTRFGKTWILEYGQRRENLVGAVGFYGTSIVLGHGSKGGWDKFGPERRITRSVGNVLYELDGRPALDLYTSYLGELAAGLPATALLYPLAIRPSVESTDPVVRTVLAHDSETKSLTFAGDVPEGSFAQLMRANVDRLVLAAADAAEDCKRGGVLGGNAMMMSGSGSGSGSGRAHDTKLCVAVSCVGRRLVLKERAEEETEAVADVVPSDCPIIGFYSYGELSPALVTHGVGGCRLHNQTMTLTTFSELESEV